MKILFKAIFLLFLIALLFLIVVHYPTENRIVLPSSDHEIELYSNQTNDNLSTLFTEAIQNAQKSITLSIYSLTDPQILRALQKATENSIAVTIICDAKASPHITSYLPQATLIRRFTKGLMHQKILIIDEHMVILGSANLTTHSLKIHGNLVVGLDHLSLAQALEKRAKSMTEEGGYTPLPVLTTEIQEQHLELWSLPDNPQAADRIKKLLRTAQKTIQVAMFTFTRQDFTEELIRAFLRGVKVEVVIDRYSGGGTSHKVAKALDTHHIEVTLSTGNKLLHHKFALIDGEILINGSANWTKAAFQENDDYFMVLYPLTAAQKVKMEHLFQIIRSESKTLETLEKEKKSKNKSRYIYKKLT